MRHSMSISLIDTPAKEHQAIGMIERRHHIARSFMLGLLSDSDFQSEDAAEIASISTLLRSGQVSQIDGQTPGHRIYGRAPKLPMITAEAADFTQIHRKMLHMEAPETAGLRI